MIVGSSSNYLTSLTSAWFVFSCSILADIHGQGNAKAPLNQANINQGIIDFTGKGTFAKEFN